MRQRLSFVILMRNYNDFLLPLSIRHSLWPCLWGKRSEREKEHVECVMSVLSASRLKTVPQREQLVSLQHRLIKSKDSEKFRNFILSNEIQRFFYDVQ